MKGGVKKKMFVSIELHGFVSMEVAIYIYAPRETVEKLLDPKLLKLLKCKPQGMEGAYI